MIVNPQLFSSRFLVIVVALATTTMSIYGIRTYFELKAHQDFIRAEKQLLANELQQMISNYDVIEINNRQLLNTISEKELEHQKLTDSFISVLGISRQFSSVQAPVMPLPHSVLKTTVKASTLSQAEVSTSTETVITEQGSIHPYLNIKRNTSPQHSKVNMSKSSSIYNLEARGIKTHLGQLSTTTKASQTTYIEVNFDISKHKVLNPNQTDIYIQVLNPINYIIGERSSVDYGNNVLIYSKRFKATKSENNISVIVPAHKPSHTAKNDFETGQYIITIFSRNEELASTQLLLN